MRSINNLISGKTYDKHVGYKPGRRMVEEDPLRGYYHLQPHSLEAPSREVQCKLIDTETIEAKIEKKLQRAFELKADKLKSKIKDLEGRITTLREDVREKERKLEEHGVAFEAVAEAQDGTNSPGRQSELSGPGGGGAASEGGLPNLYEDIQKLTSLFSAKAGAATSLKVEDLDNLAVFQAKIHDLDIFKQMTADASQCPVVTKDTKTKAR